MKFIFSLTLLVLLCSATVKASNLRRRLDVVPTEDIIKFKIGSDIDVYIQGSNIVKKKGNEFTYFTAKVEKDEANQASKYTAITPQFECKGTTAGSQTLNECKTNKAGCTDTLPDFTIKYSSGSGDIEDETDTPAGKENGRELGTASAEFIGTTPTDAGDIAVVTNDQGAKDIMTKFINRNECKTSTDKAGPVPDEKVLKFVVDGDTMYLSKNQAVKKNKVQGYTYYTVVKDDVTVNTESKYTLTPKYICDGKSQFDSLNDCTVQKAADTCTTKPVYKIQYKTGNPETATFVDESLKNKQIEIVSGNVIPDINNYDEASDCKTGSTPTTGKVPKDKILTFTISDFTYYIKNNDIIKFKGDEYYHYTTEDFGTDDIKSTYTPQGILQCKGEKPTQTLTECKATKTECSIDTLPAFSIKYNQKDDTASFETPPTGFTGKITVVGEEGKTEAENAFKKYKDSQTCKTGSSDGGDDGEIDVNDLSAIPENSQVKSNKSTTEYILFTDNIYYSISKKYQIAVPVSRKDGEHNTTYTIAENADLIEKSTGFIIGEDDDEDLRKYECTATSKKFVALPWLRNNCNETKINEWVEINDVDSTKSFVLAANDTIVYQINNNSKAELYGNIVTGEIIHTEDKSWVVYPSLLIAIILIIFI